MDLNDHDKFSSKYVIAMEKDEFYSYEKNMSKDVTLIMPKSYSMIL